MAEVSAGLMMYRRCGRGRGVEVLLVHPGGPYWVKKDAGAWTIPKGRVEAGEDLLAAARREFVEETGVNPPPAPEGGEDAGWESGTGRLFAGTGGTGRGGESGAAKGRATADSPHLQSPAAVPAPGTGCPPPHLGTADEPVAPSPLPRTTPDSPRSLGVAPLAAGPYISLGWIKQRGGKVVHAWAFEGACEAGAIVSNTMRMEWPARSGRWIEVPEVDRAGWFGAEEAKGKINAAQGEFVERLVRAVEGG